MNKAKRLIISLLVLLGCSAGAWAIEQDTDGYYLIGSLQDWQDFAALIETTPAANAKMIRDVDLGDDQTVIGSRTVSTTAYSLGAGNHYSGIFDGQGHTLTVAYNATGTDSASPFSSIEGATIKNLHIDGTMVSPIACGAGVASATGGTGNLIQNVWVSTTITGNGQGWNCSAGIIGCVKNGSVTISDCLFTGSVTSSQSHNGCFVGYIDRGSATISNCLSTGTFTYGHCEFQGSHSNCYVKQFPISIPATMQVTDEQITNGSIASALGDSWVQDPLTKLPTLKIFASLKQDSEGYYEIGSVQDWKNFAELVNSGTNTAANAKMIADVDLGDDQTYISPTWHGEFSNLHYHGTFDGQGHTLTVHYSSSNMWHTPFSQTSGATIKNLHVAGTIKSTSSEPSHMSGLISNSAGNDVIQNVWVSADITGGNNSWIECGAFVGCNNCGNTTITDCLFTGSITTTGGNNGCFAGWVQSYSPSSVTTTNCLSTGTFTLGSSNSVSRGTLNNCYVKSYPASIPSEMQFTDAQLADGTIAYKLQVDREALVWGQRIGIDPEPVLTNDESYRVYKCINGGYTNDPDLAYLGLQQDADGNYLIGSVLDWQEFAELVNTGTNTAANAKMTADIDLGDDQTMIGSGSINAMDGAGNVVFKGTFDGQGHTLTVNYNNSETFVAPFRFIFGATIKNIHVKGSVTGSGKWLGGIVASVVGRNIYSYLENCYSSVSVTSTNSPSDNTEHIGGIVSQHAWESNLSLTDCIFDGTLKRKSARKTMSGLVGCSDGMLNVNNCINLGNLIDESDNSNRVATLAYPWTHGSLNAVNTYYKNAFGTLQGTQATTEEIDDGTTATALQADRSEEIWVQDPVLGIPMLKIFANLQDEEGNYLIGSIQDWRRFAAVVNGGTTNANAKMIADVDLGDDQTMIGTSSMKYQGTFDGQAHTLSVNYSGSSEQFVAPFHYVDGGTIKNLQIKGTVSSSNIHLSGLIGKAYNDINVTNCVVAAEIKMNNDYAAGFVGNGGSRTYGDPSKVVFKDCLFTGTFTGVSRTRNTAAGFWGWGASTPVFINCLEYGTYNNISGFNPFMYEGTDRENTETTANSYYKHGSINIEGISDASDMHDGDIVVSLGEAWVLDPTLGIPMLEIFAKELTYTVPSKGYGTFSAKGSVLLPDGLTAHYCRTYNAERSTIGVVHISGNVVPAATGVLLKGTAGETYTLTGATTEAPTTEGNALVAVTEATHVEPTDGEFTNFMMKNGEFLRIAQAAASSKMPANRAYLQIATDELPKGDAGARNITIVWEETPTGITSITSKGDGSYYTVSGVKLSKEPSQKGIYIVNGKKVIK